MASVPSAPLSEEEYLRIDRARELKSEFYDGQMFAMSGGSFAHARLAANILTLLNRQTHPGCLAFGGDLRVKAARAGLYTYPDAGVVCGEPQFAGESPKDTLLNPALLVEVLSPATENYDRGQKFASYRTIESLRDFLLIHQDRRHVEHYSKRDDGAWVLRDYYGDTATVAIDSLGLSIAVAELYSAVPGAEA